MAQQFRKKPVIVTAIQWTGANVDEVLAFCFTKASVRRDLMNYWNTIHIDTLEGTMRAEPNDWIVCGVAAEYYPVKPDIFAMTYEAVGQPEASDAVDPVGGSGTERLRAPEDSSSLDPTAALASRRPAEPATGAE